jgi:gliding motility-associated-like protein
MKKQLQKISFLTTLFLSVGMTVLGQAFPNQFATSGLPNGISRSYVAQILDYNNDNLEDLIYFSDPVTSGVLKKELYKNNGDGTFTNQANFNVGNSLVYYENLTSPGWMKILDFNSDGYIDIISQKGDSLFFLQNNQGTGAFINKSVCFGFSSTVVPYNQYTRNETPLEPIFLSDIDVDGDVDILFGRIVGSNRSIWMFKNELSINHTFSQLVEIIPNISSTANTPVVAFDYDNDQDEDILTVLSSGSAFTNHPLKLYRNDGNLNFVDVSVTANIGSSSWWAFANIADLNNDGNLDVIIGATDASQPNRLLINNGNGTFTNNATILESGAGNYYYGRSLAIDYDNDMDLDVNWEGSGFGFPGAPLQINNGGLSFTEIGATHNLKTNVSATSQNASGKISWLDVDNDGFLDHFRSKGNIAGPFLQKNSLANGKNYINIKLKACSENINALGSKVKIVCGSNKIFQTNSGAVIQATGGDNSSIFHFGTNTNTIIDSIIVFWPGSGTTVLTNIATNQLLTIEQVAGCNNSFNVDPIVNFSNDTLLVCASNVLLDATNSAAGTYSWNTGETTPSISVDSTGLYEVTVFDPNGCSASDSIFVSVINSAITTSNAAICLGDTSVLTVSTPINYSIWWSDGTVNIDSIVVNPIQNTSWEVTVSDGVSFCNDSITIQVNNPQINAGVDISVCAGDSTTLTASGASTYLWDNGVVNGLAFVPTIEGYYNVIGTDTLGCSNSVAIFLDLLQPTSSSISPINCVTYTAPDGAIYTSSGQYTAIIANAAGCDSSISINLIINTTSSGTDTQVTCDSYTWIDGKTYNSSNNSATFVLQNSNGCDSTVTLNLTINKLTSLNAGNNINACQGENISLSATGATSYIWTNGVSNGVPFVPPTGTTIYTVTGTDDNGCTAMDSLSVLVEYCLDISGGISPNGDNANDTWTINGLNQYPDSKVYVFDRWGQKVFSGDATNPTWNGTYEGKELPTADYYYIIELGNGEKLNGVVTLKK